MMKIPDIGEECGGVEGPEYKHMPNRELDALYAVLVSLGYEMSDEEKEMQNGTHELLIATENE